MKKSSSVTLTAMLLACALCAQPSVAQTSGNAAAIEVADAESVMSMRVDGELVFDTTGKVIQHKVITEGLTDEVRDFADARMAQMHFEPVKIDGRLVNARTFTRMTLLARPKDNGNFSIEMESAHFFDGNFSANGAPKEDAEAKRARAGGWTLATKRTGLSYPVGLARSNVSGAVAVRVLLREDGSVEDAFVTQSALFNVRGRDKALDRARALFEKESLRAVRTWKFNPPANKGDPNDLEWRSGDMGIFFTMDGFKNHKAGQWRQEARGPQRVASWELTRDGGLVVGISAMDSENSDWVAPDTRIKRVN